MRWIAAFTFAITAAPVFAETIYKYVDETGAVLYSSERIPGAGVETRLIVDPSANVAPAPPPAQTDEDAQHFSELEAGQEWQDRAREEVLLAHAELEAAEAALIAGQTALPGERKGTCVPRVNAARNASGIACMSLGAGGTNAGSVPGAPGRAGIPGGVPNFNGVVLSRAEEGYDERIAKLEAAVEEARARLQNAILKEKGY